MRLGPGPSPGFSSRWANNQKEVPKTRGGHILKILYWMYAANRGSNVKWGAQISNGGGRAPLTPPLATTLRNRHNFEVPCEHSKRVSTKPGSEEQSLNPRKNENTVLRNASYARTSGNSFSCVVCVLKCAVPFSSGNRTQAHFLYVTGCNRW